MAYKRYNKKRSYKRSYAKRKTQKEKEIDIIAAFFAIVWLWAFWIYQNFMKDNMAMINFYAKIFLCVIAIAGLLFLLYKLRAKRMQKAIEQEKRDNIPVFLRELEAKIKEFSPAQHYKEERLYQAELVWFLKNNYPHSKVEETRDYKRPDIIIDDIAIEIKGPTRMSCLKTLPDKINSYLPAWDYLFIVLFNIEVHADPEKNREIYEKKKQEILENTIESKKDKLFFIEI